MKFIALLVCALIASALAQKQVCPSRTCVKAGSQCNFFTDEPQIRCRGDSYCYKTISNLTVGTCEVPKQVGEKCYDIPVLGDRLPYECVDGTECNPQSDGNSTCGLTGTQRFGYLYPGESCSGDLQCINDNPNPGVDADRNYCKSGNCKSQSNGDYCRTSLSTSSTSYDQCHYGKSYCSNANRCEKYLSRGAVCSYTDQTQYGCGKPDQYACMPSTALGREGTCQEFGSREAGQFCRGLNDCKEGLFCPTFNATLGYSVCTAPRDTVTRGRPCNFTSDCTRDNAETCVCTKGNQNSQICIVTGINARGQIKATRDYNRCYRTKGCDTFGCGVAGACKSKYCDVAKIFNEREDATVNCMWEGVCNSAFALAASPFVLLVAFVAIFAL